MEIKETVRKDKELADYILTLEYGDLIYHQEISGIIGEKYGSPKYNTVINAAKRILLDAGHMIVSVRKTGYKVVKPDDYSDIAVSNVVAGARRITKGAKILKHAPVAQMSVMGRMAHNRVNDRMQILEAAVAGAKVEVFMLNKKSHPLLVDSVNT